MILPGPIKKLIGIFRGDAVPVLIILSVMSGFWFGLMPGFYGIHVAILALALVLNINIGVFLLSAALGKAICYAAAGALQHRSLGAAQLLRIA
ncbi:MAG: hypothetical protein IPK83_10405 [Planctomycetes bacterium]|nr:hypothetical protein [Planctomycetota bacterium]